MEWADPNVVEAAATEWTDAQIACRTNGHAWRSHTVIRRPGLYSIRQRCSRNCGCWRETDMNDDGYLVSGWKMIYPKSGRYLLRSDDGKGVGRVGQDGRARLRLAGLRNAVIIEEEPEDA
jgi:hypothetical protein